MVSAVAAFCSTSRMAAPSSWMRCDGLEDVLDQVRREAHGGLVQQQDARLGHQRPAHGQHLLLAARQRAGDLRAALLEPREHLVGVVHALLHERLVVDRVGAHVQVLLDGQLREDAPPLGHLHHAARDHLVRSHVSDVLAVEVNAAFLGHEQAADRVERRRLAGAVGPDERHDLALVDGQRDARAGHGSCRSRCAGR